MKKFSTLALGLLAALFGVQQAQAQNAYAAAGWSVGDSVELDGTYYLVGPNLVTNGDFDEDPSENNNYIVGWTNAAYEQMTTSTFNWYSSGGYDDGAYITGTANYGSSSTYSIGQRWSIDSDSKYYFSFWISGLTADNQYVPVVSITNCESTAGGQNEYLSQAESNGGTATMLLGANGDSGEEPIGYANWNSDGSWANTAITFDSEECTYLQFNARWLVSADYYGFDGFVLYKLYDPETTSKLDLLLIQAAALADDGYDLLEDLYDVAADVYAEYFEILIYETLEDAIADEDEDALETVIAEVDAAITEGEAILTAIETLLDLIEDAESDAELGYDGLSDLEDAINAAQDFADEGYGYLADINSMISSLEEAINTYLFSQPASSDSPADYTFLLSTPYYLSDNALVEISYSDDNAGIASISYVNEADYSSGTAPDDASSDGWYTGTTGGDQRLNYFADRVCWNAWRTGDFTVAIYQDLEDLPNGIYTISAEMLTQSGCISDQHLVANGSNSTISATLTSDDAETWEWLTSEKVLVLNGKLTVGAEGSQLYDEDGELEYPGSYSDYRGGWFIVTNWRLLYYGEASDEEIVEYYNTVVAEATALVDSVYYAADKAALEAVIAEYGSVTSDYGVAVEALNEAIEEAEASIDKYEAVSEGTLLDLQTYISDGTYSTNMAAIAQTAVDIMLALEAADDATYEDMDDYTTILRYYRDTYLPVLEEAETLLASLTDETAIAALTATIESQVAELSALTEFPTTDELDEYIAELENAIAVCTGAQLIADGATDLTELIVNNTCDASGSYVELDGWTITYTNGNTYSNSGQGYDGDSDNRYLDSYNSTSGNLLYTAYQTITIPNGTYELGAKMRATGTTAEDSETGVGQEGVYLFAVDGSIQEDTLLVEDGATSIFAPAHVQATDDYYVGTEAEEGVSYTYGTDTYGPIWLEAYIAVNNDEATSEQEEIAAVNSGIGYGWFYNSLQITVTNRTLTVGVTTDSTLTAGHTDTEGNECVPFSGTWFSADDFTLTQISSDDDYNIATGIESVATESEGTAIKAIYSLDGRQLKSLDSAPAGIYIIREEGRTIKVLKQ